MEESKFYKEILLTNDTSGNSVLIKVSSESKADLDEFLSNNQLSLSSEIVDIQQLMNQSEVENKSNNAINDSLITVDKIITVEILVSNLVKNDKNFSIDINPKQKINMKNNHKNFDFSPGSTFTIRWKALDKFIGIINYTQNYFLYARKAHKKSFWHSWDETPFRVISNGTNPLYQYFEWTCLPNGYRDVAIDVMPDIRSGSYRDNHYKVVYYSSEFRGQNCTNEIPASFDSRNCFVASPPVNTKAFIFNNYFYYTPVNGNQCPMPGSVFDNANCVVYKIPTSTKGFIFQNNFYVQPELILTNASVCN